MCGANFELQLHTVGCNKMKKKIRQLMVNQEHRSWLAIVTASMENF